MSHVGVASGLLPIRHVTYMNEVVYVTYTLWAESGSVCHIYVTYVTYTSRIYDIYVISYILDS